MITDPGALGDTNEAVRKHELDAAIAVLDAHGKENITPLLTIFQSYLDSPALNSERHDHIRESVIILLGALAKHLEPTDERIPAIVERLLATLKTPSEPVQTAVAECLPPLVKANKDKSGAIIERMMDMTINGESYAIRRGGAYGLAGSVKGRGIGALKDCGVMDKLKSAIEDKKRYESREGSLFAFETMSQMLGRLFEPYILQILPYLLTCFGDGTAQVREAVADTARVIMSNLSAHCIKLLLPAVLKGLEDYKWRTKAGSIELLGFMAYCAPKQLALSLPTIIPRLSEVLTDSHTNVQNASKAALIKFTDVIHNPEIKSMSSTLMQALADPSNNTLPALVALMETSFAHYIDAPSLALVIPIIERGLKERSTDVKKKAAHIMGSMTTLTEPKDLIPYMNTLLPLLREVLVDPVPETRAIAAKALGSIVERLGEDNFPMLIAELVQTLRSDSSGVDRQGAAQGLAEVLTGLGISRLEEILPEVVINVNSPKPYVREGFMSLLIYLPATFGDQFQPYLARVVPSILSGLADEFEYVREAALKAAQIIVARFANTAIDLLLPELEKGLFDENWRIRQSSVQLLGDLLYKIGGIHARPITSMDDEEETGGNESDRRALVDILGVERYQVVLASVYIIRSDVNAIVRQSSLHVWKSLVNNTPRTLKEILPTMMEIIVQSLASSSYEKRQVAAATLGDLVHKLGEFIMTEIVPILKEKLRSPDDHTRQGVCVGLAQILKSMTKHHAEVHSQDLIDAVKMGLCDPVAEVREPAAQAFDMLHEQLGPVAIDEILPPLLAGLKNAGRDSFELEALKEIMAVRGNVVFPMLVPNLIARPISAFNARALASLIEVGGNVVNKKMGMLLAPLLDELHFNPEIKSELEDTINVLVSSIDANDGLHTLMMMLFEAVKPEFLTSKRAAAFRTLELFCTNNTKLAITVYAGDWLKTTISLMDESTANGDMKLVVAAWKSLDALVKRIKKDDLDSFVGLTRRAVQNLISDVRIRKGSAFTTIDGFQLPKVRTCSLLSRIL